MNWIELVETCIYIIVFINMICLAVLCVFQDKGAYFFEGFPSIPTPTWESTRWFIALEKSPKHLWNQLLTLLSVRISMAFFRSKSLIFRWNSCNVSRTAARLVEIICWQSKVFFCKTSHFYKMATVVSTSGLFSITSSVPVSWPALTTYIYIYTCVYIYICVYIYMTVCQNVCSRFCW